MLVQMDPEKYGPNAVYEKGNEALYLKVLKYIYGMLQIYLISYIFLRKYLDTDGLKFNQYDPCVVHKIIEVDPLTIVFHVYDVKEIYKGTNMVNNYEQ